MYLIIHFKDIYVTGLMRKPFPDSLQNKRMFGASELVRHKIFVDDAHNIIIILLFREITGIMHMKKISLL